ncbi:NADH dehydrogenase 1 beta subcomplex subunit 9 [Zalerion maritima]|uniref:NADH dehydrogenase [ubiquinone] 1 beta subcomplex subunit 9 n=1 Tax=Zalerion maritima TaxID=339359 RepID=A0AAD5RRT0_9PEZI|nr:NADH dehydrogenase 1 beta subcomplex subunit 9 [Zalerion maritima]
MNQQVVIPPQSSTAHYTVAERPDAAPPQNSHSRPEQESSDIQLTPRSQLTSNIPHPRPPRTDAAGIRKTKEKKSRDVFTTTRPVRQTPARIEFRSLYRRSLKLALDWAVHRHVWRGQAMYIRSLFEANKSVTDPRMQRDSDADMGFWMSNRNYSRKLRNYWNTGSIPTPTSLRQRREAQNTAETFPPLTSTPRNSEAIFNYPDRSGKDPDIERAMESGGDI